MVNVSFLQELLNGIAERGRTLLPRALVGGDNANDMVDLARALVSGRGEASGVALARQIIARYGTLDEAQRNAYFSYLADNLGPNYAAISTAASAFMVNANPETYRKLTRAAEPPRQEFFRRLNLAPGATAAIVAMRRDMLDAARKNPKLNDVDADLMHLLGSWFNRGFLVLRRIDWSTPANILEKIIAYEAVHEIQGWDDLRRRLDPVDRRCFAFFHPSLVDEPLIFVEVALDAGNSRLDPRSAGGGKDRTRRQQRHAADDGRVLFDLELPGWIARHLVRQFSDQAGRRGTGARNPLAQDLRDAVSGSRLCLLAQRPDGRQ